MQAIYTQFVRKLAPVSKKADLANIARRLAAFAIDAVCIYAVIAVINYFTVSSNENTLFLKPELVLYILFGWLYFAGSETCSCEGSLGKHMLGLKVTNTNGTRLSFKNATIRYFTKPLTFFTVILRFIVGTAPASRQLLHDRLANAQVVSR